MRTASALLLASMALPAAAQQARIQARDLPLRSLPAALAHQGTPVAAKRWTDRLGENTLILTQTGRRPRASGGADAEVYAYHYVANGGPPALLWRTTDFVRDCEFDLYAGYLRESVAVTDLDRDGTAETSFLYLLACRSDVSPAGLKLILHEGERKYAARGTSRPRGATEGGEVRLDDALTRVPAFAAFARAQWQRFRGADTFQQF